jgi:PBP superfamily domain
MRNQLVRAAVVAALAGAAATAANATGYTIHISGASAQRTFWESDLEAIATGTFGATADAGSTTVCFLTKTTAALNPAVPDVHSLSCTISAARGAAPPALPAGLAAGDVVTLAYEAEFGSVWGIAPFVPGSRASTVGRRSLVALASGGTQTVAGYSRDQDTATSGLTAPSGIDIGVSDLEPVLWASPDNWPVSDGIGGVDGTGTNNVISILGIPGQGQPTLAQLQALQANWVEVNGEVFSVVVDNSATPGSAITNLSTQSLRAIFTGQYKTWSQVPEVGTAAGSGASIVVCRRDHGSGTQVMTSQYFTQTECGGNPGVNGSGASAGGTTRFVSSAASAAGGAPGVLDQTIPAFEGVSGNPVENYSSNDVKACLLKYPGASIGILSLSPGAAYNTLSVDNVPANAHNAANGAYKYASTTWAFNNTANNQPSNTVAQAIASTLILDAQKVTRGVLPKEAGTMTAGVWNVGTGNTPQVVYGVQDGLNAAPTPAANSVNPSAPVAVWKNTPKSICNIPLN